MLHVVIFRSLVNIFTLMHVILQDFEAEELCDAEISPQMNRIVHILRSACLRKQDPTQSVPQKKVIPKIVSEMKIDFEVLHPINLEQYRNQVMQSLKIKQYVYQ